MAITVKFTCKVKCKINGKRALDMIFADLTLMAS